MDSPVPHAAHDSIIPILKNHVIPTWERFGMERLAVSADTLQQLKKQPLPERMRTSVKKRIGKKVRAHRSRSYNNSGTFVAVWPEDQQAIFQYPALAYVVSGEADFPVADYVIHCPQGHFLLFADNVPRATGGLRPHFESGDNADRHCDILWFFAPPGTNSVISYICHSLGEEHWYDKRLDYHSVHGDETVRLFKNFLRELQEQPENSDKIAPLYFQTFLQVFLRELQAGRFHQAGKTSRVDEVKTAMTAIEQAQEYVKNHLNQPLTATSVAREVFMSRNSFMQHFTRETGQTFHDYLTAQRMEEVKRLLSDGYWSLALLSKFVGLRPTQLRSQFKKHCGVTPSAFRFSQQGNAANGEKGKSAD